MLCVRHNFQKAMYPWDFYKSNILIDQIKFCSIAKALIIRKKNTRLLDRSVFHLYMRADSLTRSLFLYLYFIVSYNAFFGLL